jgi:hypothetical protein
MHKVVDKTCSAPAELRQHFHNYFELLLGAERSKLQLSINDIRTPSQNSELLIEIECRINYLRGAIRMGRLLCLLDHDEAKANFGLLAAERERLLASAKQENTDSPLTRSAPTSARLSQIRNSLRTAKHL